jgi:hypothetical protein
VQAQGSGRPPGGVPPGRGVVREGLVECLSQARR